MCVSRKTIVVFILFVGFVLITSSTMAATVSSMPSANLLLNNSFEDGAYLPTNHPDNWDTEAFNAAVVFTWDDAQAYDGSKSVKIESSAANDARWIQTVPVQPYSHYRLSAWIKTDNIVHVDGAVHAGANIGVYDPWTHSTGVYGTNDWTFVRVDFKTEAHSEVVIAARLGFWSGTVTGTAWYDNVRLERIDPLPYALANAGFEDGDSSAGYPDVWTKDAILPTAVSLTWDNTAYQGSHSVKIDVNDLSGANWIQTVAVMPHSDYRFSGWIKTENVAHSPDAVDAGANLTLYGTWTRSPGLFGTNDWTYEQVEFNTGAETEIMVSARMGFWSGRTTGTAWYDNLKLELINVPIDIVPRMDRNIIPHWKRFVSVAVLSSNTFDAPAMVDPASLMFGPTGYESSLWWQWRGNQPSCKSQDVNRDGFVDLNCDFEAQVANFRCGDDEGILKGAFINGVQFEGRDAILIMRCH
ncbi:MAG: hypothetical protein GY943_12890 [Chloroflexi bacterium]|nr:hypothetical protein [Chloroflexota bacterium]